MPLRTSIPPEDREDLRLAVVMNGGVSLAIWIGGVSQEVNRLVRSSPGDGTVYGGLLEIVAATARVDVIAGTSAGGINGAFLALASVYDRELGGLGQLWADKGGLMDLFRPALQSDPPSLMRGDEYFLPALRDAFDAIAPVGLRGAPKPPGDVPVDLVMTTSLMNGTLKRFVDDFGNPVNEIEHKGRFTFRRGAQVKGDPFAADDITAKLALAARSTASFPVAFEPSYIPVGEQGQDRLHPDMAGAADWDGSRFVLDGGVLLNKPVRPALEAVFAQPADRQVRRVLAYVVPDPGDPEQPPPDDLTKPPGAGRVLADTLVALPRAQSIAQELEELREHNRKVRDAQAVRPEVTPAFGPAVESLAPPLFETYRMLRARRAVTKVADIVGPLTAPPPEQGAPSSWTREELLEAFGANGEGLGRELPFVPASFDLDGEGPWAWGLAPAERLGRFGLDVFRRALLVAPWDATDVRRELARHRARLHALHVTLRQSRAEDDRFWAEQAALLGTPPHDTVERGERLAAWAGAALEAWPVAGGASQAERHGVLDALERTTYAMVDVLVEAAPAVRDAVALGIRTGSPYRAETESLRDLLNGVGLGDAPKPRGRAKAAQPPPTRAILTRVFAAEVALLALGAGTPFVEQAVDLVQVSADTPNGFGGPVRVAKLAGVQMGHFGAFYKKSWRVNDWIWGRVDGVTRLAQIVLEPGRLRQLRLTSADVLDAVRELALGGPRGERLAPMFEADRPRIEAELAFLDEDTSPLPPSLPVTAMAVARRVQAEIVTEEMGRLAAAVHSDVDAGGGRGAGVAFARAYATATEGGRELEPDRALALFATADIASETALAEAGTDLFARTASRAAAVGVSAADAKGTGLGPARVITRALRGVMLVVYGLVYGATQRSRVGTAAVNAALATGGALLAVALLTDVSGPVKAVATALLLGALALAMLRSRMWEVTVAIGVPFTAVLAVLLARDDLEKLWEDSGPIVTVVGLVLALMALGSVRQPAGPPFPARSHRLWWCLGGLAASGGALAWMLQARLPGVVPWELAFTPARATGYLRDFANDPDVGLAQAAANIRRDYLYLALYWIAPAALAGWAAAAFRRAGSLRWAKAGDSVAWLPVWAAVFDAAENAFLLRQIAEYGTDGGIDTALAPLAGVAAAWKFLLLAAVVVYVLAGLVAWLRSLRR